MALKQEIGNSRHAVKTLARQAGASERTAQNWLSGVRGPSGLHLILLAQHFAAVRSTITLLVGNGAREANASDAVVQMLHEAISLLEHGE